MRTRVAVLAVAFASACSGSGGGTKPGAGAVAGTVHARPKAGVRGPSSYESTPGAPRRLDYDRLDGIVVWLEGPGSGGSAAPPVLRLGAKGFEPEVAAVASGDPVVIENASGEPATIYAVSAFDAGTLAPGARAEVRLARHGPVEVLVEERDARAHVLVAPTRRVVVLRSGGDFRWEDLAPGSYVLRAWHRRLPEATAPVTVAAGATAEVDLELSVQSLPKAP